MKQLTPDEIAANKALGLHPQFWLTAHEMPAVITPDWLTEMCPAWKHIGQEIAQSRYLRYNSDQTSI